MEIPVKKNQELILEIIDNGMEGEGIAKIDNFAIFIPGTIKGEKVKVLIVKVLSSHAFGKVIEIIEKSKERIESNCNTSKRCGGCSLRHVRYPYTLKMKRDRVQNLMDKQVKQLVEVKDAIGMKEPNYYRNKAQFPIGTDKGGEPVVGVFASRSHEIIPIVDCKIQNRKAQEIAKSIMEFIKENSISVYDEKIGKGLCRHIVIKVGVKTQEIMCVLVINGESLPKKEKLVKKLTEQFPEIKTVVLNKNKKNTNVILGKENENIYGDGYITDKLGEYEFKISPLSFYQTNPVQTEVLYNKAIQLAELEGEENLVAFDLYCGIGTITLFLSKYFQKVYGIEIVEQAILDAKENAKRNAIDNVEFILGDVEFALTELIEKEQIIPDVIFVDPPRKGLDITTIENLLKMSAKKIVYISCNPATLARDLAMLEEKYKIKEIQPVDMFPYTSHVECVAVLQLK